MLLAWIRPLVLCHLLSRVLDAVFTVKLAVVQLLLLAVLRVFARVLFVFFPDNFNDVLSCSFFAASYAYSYSILA
jgi:hypothetical protein